MKKLRVCAVLLCLVLLLGSCGNQNEYVKLGEYKGLEISVESTQVTDAEVDAQIQRLLQDKSTKSDVTGRPVQDGDIVNIDYEGLMDGKTFEGGSATGFDLTIGSGGFIEGFESGLIGAEIGESRTLELAFPDPYDNNPDLAGKPATFKVTVNSIQETVEAELTDEFVQSLGDYQTVEDYKTALRDSLQKQKDQAAESNRLMAVREALFASCEIRQYPDGELDTYVNEMVDYYTNYAASSNMTLEDYVKQNYGMTEAQFKEQAQETAKKNVGLELIYAAIAEKEGITVTDEEYKEICTQYTQEMGFESEEAFIEYYGGEEGVRENILFDKVLEFVSENAVEKTA